MSVVLPGIVSTALGGITIKDGYPAVAEVVDIAQTGVTLNQVPLMRMVVRISGNGAPRVVTIRQFVDLGNMPRAGEQVRIVIDKTEPERATYVGLARTAQ
ncbi:hypothetical protein [Burkholderia stagnalis]|uniref:hypothetical protein n=1 Tax=Burkholderia stagnalis TaxID=1503054 RepID=UPI000F8120B3